jgi:hypothetical protein
MSNPGFPLNFSSSLGDKISLWGNSGAHYGFGIQSLLFQMHTDLPSADIAFGYGSSGSFTENMRIKGNGNVGIGITDPAFKLDVADRMRIRSGGGFSSAGLYLNNNANTASPAFIGMDDDTHVGFWGSGGGWKFSMNTQTGALKVNGSEGTAGQALTSTGIGTEWKSPTNAVYNSILTFGQTSSFSTTAYLTIPGFPQTINTPECKIVVIIKGYVHNGACVGCGDGYYTLDLGIDNALADRMGIYVGNGSTGMFANGAFIFPLSNGSHTISLAIDPLSDNITVHDFRMVIIVLPK